MNTMNNSINIVMGTINHEYCITTNIYPSRATREKYVPSANIAHNVMTIFARDFGIKSNREMIKLSSGVWCLVSGVWCLVSGVHLSVRSSSVVVSIL